MYLEFYFTSLLEILFKPFSCIIFSKWESVLDAQTETVASDEDTYFLKQKQLEFLNQKQKCLFKHNCLPPCENFPPGTAWERYILPQLRRHLMPTPSILPYNYTVVSDLHLEMDQDQSSIPFAQKIEIGHFVLVFCIILTILV